MHYGLCHNALPCALPVAFALFLLSPQADAGVVLDGSLGGPAGSLAGPNYAITAGLGRQVGGNLFHSFASFGLTSAETATFSGPGSVTNIISRVTGGGISNIDGRIASTIPGANFFFLNPAGIVFGPNATLDVSGSVHFSSGSYLGFADGAVFSASADPLASTLTSAEPAAFGFLGPGNAIVVNGASLAAGDHKTLSLMAGDITLNGAILSTRGGSIELNAQHSNSVRLIDSTVSATDDWAGVAPGTIRIVGGQVVLERSRVESENWSWNPAGDIDISSGGSVRLDSSTIWSNTLGWGAGANIRISAGDVSLTNGSKIRTFAEWEGQGGSIFVTAPGPIVAGGADAFGDSSEISANTVGWGDAGSVSLTGQAIRFRDGAQVGSTTFGDFDYAGSGGYVFLSATNDILFSGVGTAGYPSGAMANTFGPGSAGYISLLANTLTLADGGVISSSSYGTMGTAGAGGFIYADIVDRTTITGVNANGRTSGIEAITWGPGEAGSLMLKTRVLELLDGGQINSSTSGTMPGAGGGGFLNIEATDSTLISGVGRTGYPSAVASETSGTGTAGSIWLRTGSLSILDGGSISSGSYGTAADAGDGGSVRAEVDGTLTISGVHDGGRISSISATTGGPGGAGFISLTAAELWLLDGAQVDSTSYGSGDGGYITINVTNNTLISGVGHTGYPSALVAEATGWGSAGSINLETGSLTMTDGGAISSGTYGTDIGAGHGGDIYVRARGDVLISGVNAGGRVSKIVSDSEGPGVAGSITVEGRRIELNDGGRISSSAYADVWNPWDYGAIYVTASESLRVAGVNASGDRSGIYTDVRAGTSYAGDIYIDSPRLEVLDGGRISSAALSTAPGALGYGIIDITSDSVLISGMGWNGSHSEISTETRGPGYAGDITLRAGSSLTLSGGGRISSSTLGEMPGAGGFGYVDITAGAVLISGVGSDSQPSGIFTDSRGTGDAGSIWLTASSLTMRDGGQISSSSEGLMAGAGSGGYIDIIAKWVELSGIAGDGSPTRISAESRGPGRAGDISISGSEAIVLSGGAEIATRADQADGGNITLTARERLQLTDSRITTSVGSGFGNGGNITIDPIFVILNNSVIQANAYGGNGGNITIRTDYLISSFDSLIEASSALGIAGSIAISSPNVDVGTGLMVLPSNYLDASLLLRDACAGSRGAARSSSFVGAGNGGLPLSPGGLFTSRYDETLPASRKRMPEARPATSDLSRAKLAFSCGLRT